MRRLLGIYLTLAFLTLSQGATAQPIHWEQTSGPGGGLLDIMFTFDDGLILARSSPNAVNGGYNRYRSTNSGQTWSPFSTKVFHDPRGIGFAEVSSGLCGLDRSGGCELSTDQGITWVQRGGLPQTSSYPTAISLFACRDTIYATVWNYLGNIPSANDLYRSTDTGLTWNIVEAGLPLWRDSIRWDEQFNIHILHSVASTRSMMLVSTDSGVYRSSNGGDVWTLSNDGLGISIVSQLAAVGDTILAATRTGIFRSIDAGSHWSSVLTQPTSFLVANSHLASAIMRDSSFWFSTDVGAHWVRRSNPVSIRSVTVLGEIGSEVLVATYGQGIMKSTDTGQSWVGSNAFFNDVRTWALMLKGHDLYASAMQCGLGQSIDGGRSWSQVWTSPNQYTANCVFSGLNSLFVADDPELYRSSDDGQTWHSDAQWTGVGHELIEQIGSVGTNLLAAGEQSWFLSADTGKTWTQPCTDCRGDGSYKAAFSGDTVWYGGGSALWVSYDLGHSWNNAQGLGSSTFFLTGTETELSLAGGFGQFIVFDSGKRELTQELPSAGTLLFTRDRIIACNDTGVFETTNNGVSWSPDTVGLGINIINDMVADGDTIYLATEKGVYRGVYSGLGVSSKERLPSATSLKVFPNPTEQTTKVAYSLDKRSSVKIEIYDILGERRSVAVDDIEDAGKHETRLDNLLLPVGSYFARFSIDGVPSVTGFQVVK